MIGTREVGLYETVCIGGFDAPLDRSLEEMVCTHLCKWTARDAHVPLLIVGYAAAQLELRGDPKPWHDPSRAIRYVVTQVASVSPEEDTPGELAHQAWALLISAMRKRGIIVGESVVGTGREEPPC